MCAYVHRINCECLHRPCYSPQYGFHACLKLKKNVFFPYYVYIEARIFQLKIVKIKDAASLPIEEESCQNKDL